VYKCIHATTPLPPPPTQHPRSIYLLGSGYPPPPPPCCEQTCLHASPSCPAIAALSQEHSPTCVVNSPPPHIVVSERAYMRYPSYHPPKSSSAPEAPTHRCTMDNQRCTVPNQQTSHRKTYCQSAWRGSNCAATTRLQRSRSTRTCKQRHHGRCHA
jgi:hypothetical protein